MKKFLSSIGMTLIMCLVSTKYVSAASYYLSPSGTDSNSGTVSSPWKTFQYAFTKMKAGDTLLLRDGTYTEAIKQIPSGSSWTTPVTIKAENSRKAVIKPGSVSEALSIRYGDGNIPRTYIVVRDLVFDCTNAINRCFHIAGDLDESKLDVQNIRIINNEIKNSGAARRSSFKSEDYEILQSVTQAILNARADNVEYLNNDIHDNGVTDYDHGIYQAGGRSITIDGNKIYYNRGSGLKIGWTSDTSDNVIRNNYIYDNNLAWTFASYYGKKKQGRCISTHASERTKIYNNICIGGYVAGIDVIYEAQDAEVYNNTVVITGSNTTGRGIGIGASSGSNSIKIGNTIVKNNIIYQQNTNPPSENNAAIFIGPAASNSTVQYNMTFGTNPEIILDSEYVGAVAISNNIKKDPFFVNLASRDFHLKDSSPAINTGSKISLVVNDFSGAPRPQGTSHDIGAYEYGSVKAPTTSKLGDANGDNLVNEADMAIWLNSYGDNVEGPSRGDFNQDSVVDGIDYGIWFANYGK